MLIPFLLAQVATATPVPAPAVDTLATAAVIAEPFTWTPHRVFDVASGTWSDLEAAAAVVAREADVVFFGEQHDDAGTHAMQRALLESISRRRSAILSLEMFERDVQPLLDDYLAGRVPEDSLRAGGRPWPNYADHYRPAVEWAHANGWPVIAANIPRPIASAISRGGLATLDTLGARRALVAAELQCDHGAYFERFAETMRPHVPGDSDSAKAAALDRYYFAQCAKDETMAESIVRARAAHGPAPVIVHLNGAFHSDYALGTAERVVRRAPATRIVVLTAVPVTDLDGIVPSADDRAKARFVIYTMKAPS